MIVHKCQVYLTSEENESFKEEEIRVMKIVDRIYLVSAYFNTANTAVTELSWYKVGLLSCSLKNQKGKSKKIQ